MNVADVEPTSRDGPPSRARSAPGPRRPYKTGLQLFEVPPGKLLNPPTVTAPRRRSSSSSTARERLELWPNLRFGGEHEDARVRRGTVVARPAGTGRGHTFRAGERADGARLRDEDPRDGRSPRSGKVSFRGSASSVVSRCSTTGTGRIDDCVKESVDRGERGVVMGLIRLLPRRVAHPAPPVRHDAVTEPEAVDGAPEVAGRA